MKITICGSIAFYEEMVKTEQELKKLGHEVKLPPHEIKNEQGEMIPIKEYYRLRKESGAGHDSWIWDRKKEVILAHFDKEVWADAILVLNEEKNGVKGYIGANTLIEMGLALFLNKPIYMMHDIPEISYKEEILGMKPIVINGDLNKISSPLGA